ncbi:MFS general substrate transporter, partial [Sistotremastrum suecicum HHB10207 ss-3]
TFGVYEDFYKRHYLINESSSNIRYGTNADDCSWIGSAQWSLLFGLGIIAGPLLDKGYFRQMLFLSTLIYLLSSFTLALAKENQYYQIFLTQGLGLGLSTGLTWGPTFAVAASHFVSHRVLAMGLVSAGSGLSGLVQTIMINNFLNSSLGFRNTILISAGMNGGLMILANFLMSVPRNKVVVEGERRKNLSMIIPFLKELPYTLVTIGLSRIKTLLLTPGIQPTVVYIQLLSITKGLPPTFSFYSLSIVNGGTLLGRVAPNLIADRFGSYGAFNLILPGNFLLSITILAFLGVNSVAGVAVVGAIYGFFAGNFMSLCTPVLASLAKNSSEVGARVGISTSFVGTICPIPPPISGALLGSNFHWTAPILFSGICSLTGACCYLAARLLVGREARR